MRKAALFHRRHTHPGQAMVELALSLTFIAFLLAAAVDLGLAFKTYQTLMNASAEASSYLSQQPLLNCGVSCDLATMKAGADEQAIFNFRREIGADITSNGIAHLMDLNANGQDDVDEGLALGAGGWIRIDPADGGQFDPANPGAFDINTFTPSTRQNCIDRKRRYLGGQCFIVVRSKIIYRPFFALAPVLGGEMTIHAYAIKPIVGGTD